MDSPHSHKREVSPRAFVLAAALLGGLLPVGASVLDVGCGYGRIALPLAELGHDVTGIDISPDILLAAQQTVADYGLQAGIFTDSLDHAMRAWNELEQGGVIVNDFIDMRRERLKLMQERMQFLRAIMQAATVRDFAWQFACESKFRRSYFKPVTDIALRRNTVRIPAGSGARRRCAFRP